MIRWGLTVTDAPVPSRDVLLVGATPVDVGLLPANCRALVLPLASAPVPLPAAGVSLYFPKPSSSDNGVSPKVQFGFLGAGSRFSFSDAIDVVIGR